MSTPDGFSDNPLVAEMERRCSDMLLVSQAVVTCADVFEQACEPRPPKPGWFGTGPGQWDSWWLIPAEKTVFTNQGEGKVARNCTSIDCTRIALVLPVAREGYPAAVGWKVVGE